MKKLNEKSLQSFEVIEIPKTPYKINLFQREIKYLKPKDVKRAYSKLIQDYCKGKIVSEDAKILGYLFSGYLQVLRDVDFDTRLAQVEKKLK